MSDPQTERQKSVKKEEKPVEQEPTGPPEELLGEKLLSQANTWAPAFRMTILLAISIIAVLVRVYSVIRYESVIHEFDPWFNYRTTQYLVNNDEGIYGLWNWFDSESWYPLGRSVGGTVYPGLMATASSIYWTLRSLSIPIDIRNVCVFIAPIFAALTAIVSYLMTVQITKRTEDGLVAAFFISIVPSYMSRSVAGSYDNEGVSIFALVFTFYLWLKASNTGSILWSLIASLGMFYMVASWGGYAFIINIIPIFVLFCLITDRFTMKLYVSYNVFYIMSTILAMQIPFVNFNAIESSEHMASHGVFFILQVYMIIGFIKLYVNEQIFKRLAKTFLIGFVTLILVAILFMFITGKTQWSGRSMTLLDPTYAKKYIPIIASVSEHQATTWSSFFFDLQFLILFTPLGLYECFKKSSHAKIFAAMYVVLAVYFASVMVRLLLVLAPATCIVGAIGLNKLLRSFCKQFRQMILGFRNKEKGKKKAVKFYGGVALFGIIFICYLLVRYMEHSHSCADEAYSSPSIILSSKDKQGKRHIIDDFREAYSWLRMNTKSSDKILSWWDYGYQITGMSNRTVIVDNNTWNNTHIATVGLAMASPEDQAYEVCDKLDVDYVLVIFGGFSYYSGDDINKFLWMIRIGGGVYPHIKEEDFYSAGQYRIDAKASETMKNSLMYRLSYYSQPRGYDTVRQQEVGVKGYKLNYFEEAYTSDNWIVRIFKRKKRNNREGLTLISKKAEEVQQIEQLPLFQNQFFKKLNKKQAK